MLKYKKYRYTNKTKLNIFKLSRFVSSHLLITLILLIMVSILLACTTMLVCNHYKNNINQSNINNTNNINTVAAITSNKSIDITTTSSILPRTTIEVSRGGIIRDMVTESIVKPVVIDKKVVDGKVDKVNFDYIDSFIGNITMYTLDVRDCGKTPDMIGYGIGSSGVRVTQNHSVAMSSSVPYGTKIRVEGFNTIFVNQDTGSAIKSSCVDIFTNNRKEALKWGRQFRKVYVLSWGKKSK